MTMSLFVEHVVAQCAAFMHACVLATYHPACKPAWRSVRQLTPAARTARHATPFQPK